MVDSAKEELNTLIVGDTDFDGTNDREMAAFLVAEEAPSGESGDATDAERVETPSAPQSEGEGEPVEQTDNPDELKKGYMLHADYTRKTQELAEHKRQLEESIAATKRQYEESIQLATQYVQSGQDPVLAEAQRTDWAKLAQEDPAGYVQKRAQVEQKIALMQGFQQKQNEARQTQLKEILAREQEQLYSRVPEWKDEKTRIQEVTELSDYLQRVGFKREEVDRTIDHRALVLARKAMLFDKMAAAKTTVSAKKLAPKPSTTIRPRGGETVTGNSARNQGLLEKARKTGKDRDILAAIMANT